MFTKTKIELAKPCVEAIKKIAQAKGKEWEWEPEIGDFFLFGKEMGIVVDEDWVNPHTFKGMCIDPEEKRGVINIIYIERATPILHWEKIEKILEDWGCVVIVYQGKCEIWEDDNTGMRLRIRWGGKTRQEAVMRAIIKLGEEIGR